MNIPSREEHQRLVRKVWRFFIAFAAITFIGMASTVISMRITGSEWKDIVNVQLIMVYVSLPAYLFGYVAPVLASSLIKMSLGLEISRDTADDMKEIKDEIRPIILDVKTVVKDIKPAVSEVRNAVHEGKKLFDDAIHELREGNGHLHGKIGDTLKTAVLEARKAVRGAEGEFEQLIWKKVDQFLAGVFQGGSQEQDGTVDGSTEISETSKSD